ncbi:DUF6646 family protein [Mariniflexile ostreae]|uniref:DUF6646 family protein n=1 Tax=Mariniflexile ostreae TaxID=1520892 RepID=A0ABV5FB50_9FLAO
MKHLFLIATMLTVSFASAQAFSGKDDKKLQVGANFQNNATGLNVSYDLGVGQNISLGFSTTYALGIDEVDVIDSGFADCFDIRGRFNANLGNVLKIDDNFDVYPGLSFGLKNFGGHLGMRYFFSDGFGLYTELNTPLAKYDTGDLTAAEKLHNQFTISLGAVFNI